MNKIAVIEKTFSAQYSFAVDGGVGSIPTGIFPPIGSVFTDISVVAITATGPGPGNLSTYDITQSGVSLIALPITPPAGNVAPGMMGFFNNSNSQVPLSTGAELMFVLGGADPVIQGIVQITVGTTLTRA